LSHTQEFRSWESTEWISFCPNIKEGNVPFTGKLKKCTLVLHDDTLLSRYVQSGANHGLLVYSVLKVEKLENQ
jgi:hypothetical protein